MHFPEQQTSGSDLAIFVSRNGKYVYFWLLDRARSCRRKSSDGTAASVAWVGNREALRPLPRRPPHLPPPPLRTPRPLRTLPPLRIGSARPPEKWEGNYDAHCTVGVVIGLPIFQRLGLRI